MKEIKEKYTKSIQILEKKKRSTKVKNFVPLLCFSDISSISTKIKLESAQNSVR